MYGAILIIAGVMMYGQIVEPHLGHLKAVQQYEPTLDKMINKQKEISNKLVVRRKKLEELQTEFDTVGFTVFDPNNVKTFFEGLEQLAEEFSCSIANMDSSADKGQIIIGEASDPSYVESLEMTLSVLGEYDQLVLFIEALQHQGRQIWLKAVDIEMMKDQERVLECSITVRLYVLQQGKTEAAS